jgi:hypothetical protein
MTLINDAIEGVGYDEALEHLEPALYSLERGTIGTLAALRSIGYALLAMEAMTSLKSLIDNEFYEMTFALTMKDQQEGLIWFIRNLKFMIDKIKYAKGRVGHIWTIADTEYMTNRFMGEL